MNTLNRILATELTPKHSDIKTDGAYIADSSQRIDWDKVKFKEKMMWVFHFPEGGWNSAWGKTKKEAIAHIKNNNSLGSWGAKALLGTLYVPTRQEEKRLLSSFN